MEPEQIEPSAYDQLVVMWAKRDALYAVRKTRLTEETIAAVRIVRKTEVSLFLPPQDRARGWARVVQWYPPEHGQ